MTATPLLLSDLPVGLIWVMGAAGTRTPLLLPLLMPVPLLLCRLLLPAPPPPRTPLPPLQAVTPPPPLLPHIYILLSRCGACPTTDSGGESGAEDTPDVLDMGAPVPPPLPAPPSLVLLPPLLARRSPINIPASATGAGGWWCREGALPSTMKAGRAADVQGAFRALPRPVRTEAGAGRAGAVLGRCEAAVRAARAAAPACPARSPLTWISVAWVWAVFLELGAAATPSLVSPSPPRLYTRGVAAEGADIYRAAGAGVNQLIPPIPPPPASA